MSKITNGNVPHKTFTTLRVALALYVAEKVLGHQWEKRPLVPSSMPQCRRMPGLGGRSGCVGAYTLIEKGARVGYRVSVEKLERGIIFEM